MLKLIVMGFIAAAVLINSEVTKADPKDEASIKNVIESVAVLADKGNFEALEGVYAEEVEVDYTSLVGGEVEVKSAKKLMTEWASVLPGFDLTRHDISNINVDVNGDNASATADVTADHYIDDMFWQVKGDYLFKLDKLDGSWRITSHTLNFKEEKGTRDVFGPAAEKAAADPTSYIERQKTEAAVMDFLTSLEDKDMDKFASVWADDAVQEMPYSPEGFPRRVSGKENIIKHYSSWPEVSGNAEFTDNLIFYPMIDPEMVFVEFKGNVDIVTTGRQYLQTYGGLFHVEDGKIKLFREYYNPDPFKYAFGLKDYEKTPALGQ